MSANPNKRMTVEEYLAFERASETRHEFWGGLVYSMAGASERHVIITGNTHARIHSQLLERDCMPYANDMRVRLNGRGDFAYPDVVVVCGQRLFDDSELDTLLNPTLIVEVLSPSTETYDRGKKFSFYQQLASLQEYLLISQERMYIEQYVRQGIAAWRYSSYDDPDNTVTLPSIGCTLVVKEIYAKIKFEPPVDDGLGEVT